MGPHHKQYFRKEFPIFYKNVLGKTTIDKAIDNNSLTSSKVMIDYIVENQKSSCFAHLFEHNLVKLLDKGISLTNLFSSGILNNTVDFGYPWAEVDTNCDKMLEPFNKNVYEDLRYDYSNIFPTLW